MTSRLERVHSACWLVHVEGNSQSPFEFEKEEDARAFIQFIQWDELGEL
jgi:hypothetical protein